MRCLFIFLFFTPFVMGILRFREKGYLKLPYDTLNRYGMLRNGATKARYHSPTRMLYVIGTGSNLLHIIELTNPDNPTVVFTHEFNTPGDGEVTDVQVCPDTVAVSIASNTRASEGHVELYQIFYKGDPTFNLLGRVAVGFYPKDMAFTPDCSRLVIVNEGKPGLNQNGVFVDPEGSFTILIRNDNGFPPEINVDFTSFNSRVAEYVTKGVRYIFRGNVDANITGSFSKDLEPESVAIDSNGRYAYISLQENNAIARFDLTTSSFIDIYPLGTKNWTSFDMDASDRDGGANLQRNNIWGLYQPRDIKYLNINGVSYIITADTGAMKTWTVANEGIDFTDGQRARALSIEGQIDASLMDPTVYTKIQSDAQLGRLHIGTNEGRNFINLIQYPHAFGGRSVSMFNAVTFQPVYDTGADMEFYAEQNYRGTFNGECSNLNQSPQQQADLRSEDYGVEPTAVDVGNFNSNPVMVAGTRTGLIFAYRIIGTAFSFQSVHRRGGTTQTWNTLYSANNTGDAIISDIGYLDENSSPNRIPMVYVIGSGSSSVSLYEVYDDGITKDGF